MVVGDRRLYTAREAGHRGLSRDFYAVFFFA